MNTKTFLFSLMFFILTSTSTHIFTQNPEDILGYNPHVSHIIPASQTTKTPVVTVIGFPDPAGMYTGKFDTEKTFTVTFAFQNTLSWRWFFNPLELIRGIASINFGQEKDAHALLYAVIECYKKGHKKINIFANSRGGATTLNMLDMLSNPQHHQETWQRFGITDSQTQAEIRDMVGSGSIMLVHPLMNYNVAVKNTVATISAVLFPLPGNSYFQMALYIYSQTLLKRYTCFDCGYPDPIRILMKSINKECWPYNITIALADSDSMVGHEHESILVYLSMFCPEKLKTIQGGRNHTDIRQCLKDAREQWAQ